MIEDKKFYGFGQNFDLQLGTNDGYIISPTELNFLNYEEIFEIKVFNNHTVILKSNFCFFTFQKMVQFLCLDVLKFKMKKNKDFH